MRKHGKAEDKVYQFVCSNPGLNTYEIAKKLKMSGGNVRNALSNLHKKGLITFKFERNNPRIKKLCFAVKHPALVPKELKNKIKDLLKI
ncbi:MAG: helix-turn-helix domain-containing protein [Candidatus Aenigmatarchaeota archaeon]